jgi:hypothetical protein
MCVDGMWIKAKHKDRHAASPVRSNSSFLYHFAPWQCYKRHSFVFVWSLTRMTSIMDLPLDLYVMMNVNLKLDDQMRQYAQRMEQRLLF